MKQKKNILVFALDFIACLVLFICLGLSIVGTSTVTSAAGEQFDFFSFLDRHGISLVFLLTVISLVLIYINQKILFRDQKEEIADMLSQNSSSDIDRKEQTSVYERIFDIAPVGIFQTNRSGKVLFSNPNCAWIFGFDSVKEFVDHINGREEGVRAAYVNQQARDRMLKQLFQDREKWCHFEDQFYRRDGSTFYASCYMSLRYSSDLNEECILGFVEDITDRKEIEKKLRVSETRYRNLIEKSNSMIFKIDLDGRVSYVNQFAQTVFGYTEEELLNKHVVGTILDPEILNEESVRVMIERVCTSKDGFIFNENLNMRHDGSQIWVAWSNTALVDDDGKVQEILCVGHDVTSRKELEFSLSNQLSVERALKDISKRLADTNINDLNQTIDDSLNIINGLLDSHCTCFCLFDETGFVKTFYHQHNSGSHDDARNFMDRFILSASSWWFEKLSTEDFFIFSDTSDAPEDFAQVKEAFLKYEFSRVIVIPIRHQERLIGFLISSAKSVKSDWDEARIGMMGMCGQMFLNVINQKEAQEEILISRERFDTAVRGAYLGLFDWNVVTGDVIFNDIWFRMLGYSPNQLPHTVDTWKSLLHPDDKERVLKSLTKYLNAAESFYNIEFRLKTKDEKWKWVHAQGHVVKRDEEGKALRMIGLQRDVTEFKLMADELARQRDLFSSLIENMPAGVFVKDVKDDFRFVIWNKYMEKIFGLSHADVIGKNDYDLFDKEFADFYLRHDKRLLNTKQTQQIPEERIQTADGELWVQTVKVPILNEKKEVIFLLGILRDITEQQLIEGQLRHTQKMKSVGQLAAGIAHEVKNPLAIILLAAEGLALNKNIISDTKIANKVEIIKDSAAKADKVIVELLKFSRLDDTEMTLVDLHQAIDDAYFLAKNRDKEKVIEFEKKYFGDSLSCYGNAVLLEQVFINLFNNAIDAIEGSGKIIVRTMIKESLVNKKEIVVEVEDNGPGIPEEILTKIFDPFYTTKEVGVGTGLGLSTIFMILEKHNGTVKVKTPKAGGTKFILTFPFWDNPVENEASESTEKE